MDLKLSKRLSKLIPDGGGFDLAFGITAAPVGKSATTLSLVIFGAPSENKSPQILKKVSIPAMADNLEDANRLALENALTLLGV